MEAYAEITKKDLERMEKGDMCFSFPRGIEMKRRKGSRALFLSCSEEVDDTLIDFLDQNNLCWQEL